MASQEVTLQNFSGGELSPNMYGRYQLPVFQQGCRRCKNFFVQPQGPAIYRPGFQHVNNTRLNQVANLLRFQFNDEQAYALEFTNKMLRFYRNNEVITEPDVAITDIDEPTSVITAGVVVTITNITAASPPVVTVTDVSGLTDGEVVHILGVVGNMGDDVLNGNSFRVSNKDDGADTFELHTLAGVDANTTGKTYTSDGTADQLKDGDEIFITNVTGMPRLSNRSFLVDNRTAGTLTLTDIFGAAIDLSSGWGTGTTGTINRIYEIDTPYREDDDLFALDTTQNADTMYITHPLHRPRKLTRTGHAVWTMDTFVITPNDPLGEKSPLQKSASVSNANPAVVTSTAHGFSAGDLVVLVDISVGKTEWEPYDYITYKVAAPVNADDFVLHDRDDVPVDTSLLGAVSATKFVVPVAGMPRAVTFYESRLWYAVQDRLHASRAPDDDGATRYEDFDSGTGTGGAIEADDAMSFTLADGEVNKIEWMAETDRFLAVGTFGAELRVTGDDVDQAITPTSIKARSVNHFGVAPISPINQENIIVYVQRSGLTVRSLEFDTLGDKYISVDRNLVSDHITESGLKQIAWQTSRPDMMWSIRNDGVLLGLTFKQSEDVSGWHRHTTGPLNEDKFISLTTLPRPTDHDQLWVVTERVYGGTTHRSVCYMNDCVTIPSRVDFFSDDTSASDDTAKYKRAIFEAQKHCIHLDEALTYDGSVTGAVLTVPAGPPTLGDTGVTFTTDADVFSAADVGREIRKKAIAGVGSGRAVITAYTNEQSVDCTITETFDTADNLADGDWYYTAGTVSSLDHLEGRTVSVVADGGPHPDKTVTNGSLTLDYQASVIHVGLSYEGFLQPMSLEFGGEGGPGQGKPKNIRKVGVRFFDTLGPEIGTDLYRPEQIAFATMPLEVGNPIPLFTGIKDVPYSDNWERDSTVYIRQKVPMPCVVQALVIYGDTDND